MSDCDPPTQRVFVAEPESIEQRKCDICRHRVIGCYLLAADEDAAESEREALAEQGRNGMCAGCVLDLLMGEGGFSKDDPRKIIKQ